MTSTSSKAAICVSPDSFGVGAGFGGALRDGVVAPFRCVPAGFGACGWFRRAPPCRAFAALTDAATASFLLPRSRSVVDEIWIRTPSLLGAGLRSGLLCRRKLLALLLRIGLIPEWLFHHHFTLSAQ